MYYGGSAEHVIRQPASLSEAQSMYKGVLTDPSANNNLIPAVKANWTRELRSGKREQCSGRLEVEVGGIKKQCCLGVLSEIQGLSKELDHSNSIEAEKIYRYRYPRNDGHFERDSGLPRSNWIKSLGFWDRSGSFTIQFELFEQQFKHKLSLSELNDSGFTFEQIADIVDYFF
jgi:hypothetical protein